MEACSCRFVLPSRIRIPIRNIRSDTTCNRSQTGTICISVSHCSQSLSKCVRTYIRCHHQVPTVYCVGQRYTPGLIMELRDGTGDSVCPKTIEWDLIMLPSSETQTGWDGTGFVVSSRLVLSPRMHSRKILLSYPVPTCPFLTAICVQPPRERAR